MKTIYIVAWIRNGGGIWDIRGAYTKESDAILALESCKSIFAQKKPNDDKYSCFLIEEPLIGDWNENLQQ
jgi:hypothetical protein